MYGHCTGTCVAILNLFYLLNYRRFFLDNLLTVLMKDFIRIVCSDKNGSYLLADETITLRISSEMHIFRSKLVN